MSSFRGRVATLAAAPRLLGLSLLVSISGLGCSAAAGGSSGSPDVPAATATATPPAAATATSGPTAAVFTAVVAVLVTDTAATEGQLGSYAIDGQGSDAPWLPFGSLISVEADARHPVSIRLLDGGSISGWVADLAAWDDTSGSFARRVAEQEDGPAVQDVALGPLPAGRWVLAVRLFRADARGDGTTFWAVTVR
ncbi:MAG: hypothetical protein ABIQ17_03180 [Candidatus Limnocylindrales bacterium]